VELRFVGLCSYPKAGVNTTTKSYLVKTYSWCFFESPKDFFLGRCVVFGGKLLLFWKMGWQKNTQGFVFKDSLPMLMLQKSFPKEESHESP